jgi:short-subunit dehydrogenase
METAILFGASGGVGSEVLKLLEGQSYNVIKVGREQIDLSTKEAHEQIKNILAKYKPSLVVNCAGIFGDNHIDFDTIFNVNVKTNWSILEYYRDNKPTDKVKFITIGSSSYGSGRKDYILYAATKAALFNMYEGASEYFETSNLLIGVINPARIRTQMIAHLITPETICLEPVEVANKIIDFIGSLNKSTYINIKY